MLVGAGHTKDVQCAVRRVDLRGVGGDGGSRVCVGVGWGGGVLSRKKGILL